ncbi:glycine zipper domain-containing protein [Nocardia mexicana]|uniref:Glycine zipper domain-containing protein n=1 Tax=Nocardia mexicana TaxID=279262 RepID=A0A370GV63_9NOCA|nr:glycine zipper domain-containing protein [Nocardia mexicana]RDI46464.1 hypothetical protein DFR68_111223 [Nocardia mexicana]
MVRNTLVKSLTVISMPLVAAAIYAGPASAESSPYADQAAPVAGVPLQSDDIATNPNAQFPDPVLNGTVLGAGIGSAVGSATGFGGPVIGGLIGALIGHFNPDVVPQVLP